jgi:predicted glycosyltransferase
LRIALYSHDGLGLGHLRRNLAIAEALARGGRHPALLISGAFEATAFRMPAGVDCLALPAMRKVANGSYRPRRLGLAPHRLVRLRADTIRAALAAFEPDVLVVDKLATGLHGELGPALRHLRAAGSTRCVLGLRDVLDEPAVVREEWERMGGDPVVAELYDAVWVYGDRRVYDTVHEYGFSDSLVDRSRYTGYLDRHGECPAPQPDAALHALGIDPDRPLVSCLVGGGEDGEAVARAFVDAELPAGATGALMAGPFMPDGPRCELYGRAARRGDMVVLDFVAEPRALVTGADSVVAMGGYNTVCELLAADKRALIVPRTHPRREQIIRAERMRELDLLDMLHPDRLSPERVGAWIAEGDGPRPAVRTRIDLGGLGRIPRMVDRLTGDQGWAATAAGASAYA